MFHRVLSMMEQNAKKITNELGCINLKRIFSYLAPYKKRIALGISIKILGTLAELLIPFILTYILEHIIIAMEVSRIVLYGVIMILCSAAACIGSDL